VPVDEEQARLVTRLHRDDSGCRARGGHCGSGGHPVILGTARDRQRPAETGRDRQSHRADIPAGQCRSGVVRLFGHRRRDRHAAQCSPHPGPLAKWPPTGRVVVRSGTVVESRDPSPQRRRRSDPAYR